jgi:hypothetical protein
MKKRDYFDFSDLLGQSTEVFGETLRRAFDYDAYGGKRKFPAIVLTPPVPMTAGQAGLFTRANRPGTPIKGEKLFAGPDAAINKLDKFFFRGRIIGPNSPHAFLPDPCQYQASDTAPPDTVFKLMSMHTLFVSSEDYQLGSGDVFPSKGSVVLVELDENQFGYNLEVGVFLNVLSKTNPYFNVENVLNQSCLNPTALLDFSVQVSKFNELFEELPEVEGTVVGTSLNSLTAVVEAELTKWNGRKESDPKVYPSLKKYWENLAVTDWSPSDPPWSAAFISWVVGKADSSFPKSAGHYFYAQAAQNNTGGWSAWKVGNAKIQAQVGDILIRPRSGGGATASHGDVVYKIQGNQAILAGGNLGNTAKIAAQLSLDKAGNYKNFGKYIVVLKKNGAVRPKTVS